MSKEVGYMTTQISQSIVCKVCIEAHYAYRINGFCTWQIASKEPNPGEKLPECKEKGGTSS
jgi:hypothetical protein